MHKLVTSKFKLCKYARIPMYVNKHTYVDTCDLNSLQGIPTVLSTFTNPTDGQYQPLDLLLCIERGFRSFHIGSLGQRAAKLPSIKE